MNARRPGASAERLARLVAARVDSARLMRGMELAERGRLGGLDIIRGRVTALATGSRSEPYWVEMRLPPTGELPDRPGALVFSCTCPDWGDPCKHGVALAIVLGDLLDHDQAQADRLLGSPAQRRTPTTEPERMRPVARVVEVPSWAAEVPPSPVAHTAEQFFGSVPPPRPRLLLDDAPLERLAELGPLKVNGVDLAPHLIALVARVAGR